MRLPVIFVASIAVGAAVGYFALQRPADPAPGPAAIDDAAPGAQSSGDERAFIAPPVQSAPEPVVAPAPRPTRPPSQPAAAEPTEFELAQTKAEKLAGRERFSRGDIRDRLRNALDGKLEDRELSATDYERLTDAVFRMRAAQRVIRGIDETDATSALISQNRDTLLESLAAMESITGIAIADLGEVLADDHDDLAPEASPEVPPR